MTSQDPDVLPLPALPRLAAPGAGLPPLELQVSRLLFRAAQLVSTRVRATAQLARTRETLQRLAGKCPEEEGRRRVLIRRLPGMEDSSRYWSVFMTVEHVAIVTTAVAGIMRELSAGRIPTRTVSTASVKPLEDAGPEALPRLEQACTLVEEAAALAGPASASVRHAHPWFGPLDLPGWHFLAGFHARLHQRQVASILNQLPLRVR